MKKQEKESIKIAREKLGKLEKLNELLSAAITYIPETKEIAGCFPEQLRFAEEYKINLQIELSNDYESGKISSQIMDKFNAYLHCIENEITKAYSFVEELAMYKKMKVAYNEAMNLY